MKNKKNNYKDLLWQLVKTDFKMRYNNSVLGFVWVLLKPFLLFLVLYLVFSFVFGASDPNYRLNLLLGLVVFYYFSEGTQKGLNSILDRANIILKINFPHHIAVLASLINSFISFIISLGIFFVFWLFTPTTVTIWWLLIPVYVIIFSVLILGLSLLFSILNVKIRDVSAIWEVGLNAILYATPIIYPLSFIPERLHFYFKLNPLAGMVLDLRDIIIQGLAPDLQSLGYLTVVSLAVGLVGYVYFIKNVKKISEKL